MSLELYKRPDCDDNWHYRGSVNGRRLRGSTGTCDRKIAERFKAELEAKAWDRHFNGPGAGLTMAQVFNAYLDAEKSERFLLKLVDYWKNTLVEHVHAGTIQQAAKAIYPNAHEPTWNRQVIKPTQAAINHAAGLGWCSRISVKRFDENPEKKIPATIEWVRAFNEQALIDGLPHLGALCLFMFGTAARISEASRMVWGDVDLHQRVCKLYYTSRSRGAAKRICRPNWWWRWQICPPIASLTSGSSTTPAGAAFVGRGTTCVSAPVSSD